MPDAKGFTVTVELMYGPGDGATMELNSRRLIEEGMRHRVFVFEHMGHNYEALVPWNGLCRRVVLFHKGRAE